jgi:hypothetical protein
VEGEPGQGARLDDVDGRRIRKTPPQPRPPAVDEARWLTRSGQGVGAPMHPACASRACRARPAAAADREAGCLPQGRDTAALYLGTRVLVEKCTALQVAVEQALGGAAAGTEAAAKVAVVDPGTASGQRYTAVSHRAACLPACLLLFLQLATLSSGLWFCRVGQGGLEG